MLRKGEKDRSGKLAVTCRVRGRAPPPCALTCAARRVCSPAVHALWVTWERLAAEGAGRGDESQRWFVGGDLCCCSWASSFRCHLVASRKAQEK